MFNYFWHKLLVFLFCILLVQYAVFLIFILFVILSVTKNNANKPTFKVKKPALQQTLLDIKDQLSSLVKKEHATYEVFLDRFSDWFTKVSNTINLSSVLAILTAGVIIGFNGLIMTPLIQTMFPVDITSGLEIPGREVTLNPGQFFIALIGFILSLILFFFIAEIFRLIHKHAKTGLIVVVLIVLFAFLTFMFGWNIYVASTILPLNDCVPYDTHIPNFQLATTKPSKSTQHSLPPFGVFG